MKSRMDKYYNDEEVMQRTSKNDSLYDELYKEKQKLSNNVTVLDNVNEIDLSKIKEMMDKRENYKKVKDYNNLVETKNEEKIEDFHLEEIDDSVFDINKILEQKKKSYEKDIERIRSLSKEDYENLKKLSISNIDDDDLSQNESSDLLKLKNNAGDDLFSNLKEEPKDEQEQTTEIDETKENTFYTNTSEVVTEDFDDFKEEKNGASIFVIIAIIGVILSIAAVIYLKFLN